MRDLLNANTVKTCSDLLKLVIDGKLSPNEAAKKWPLENDFECFYEVFGVLLHYTAAYELKDKIGDVFLRYTEKLKKVQLYLEQNDLPNKEGEVFGLRNKLENPLKSVDSVFIDFTNRISGKLSVNYRDAVNRIIYWKDGRLLKCVSIGEIYDEFDGDTVPYLLRAFAFKSKIPSFSKNIRFDTSPNFNENIIIIESPIDKIQLERALNDALEILNLPLFETNKESRRFNF